MNYNNSGLEMTFPVNKLLKKLKKNRKNHKDIVKEAKQGYAEALIKEFEGKLARLKKGKNINVNTSLQTPGDNVAEYDTAIEMLKLTTDKTIVLAQAQFHSYVMDKWAWQASFLSNASNYSSSGSLYLTSNSW